MGESGDVPGRGCHGARRELLQEPVHHGDQDTGVQARRIPFDDLDRERPSGGQGRREVRRQDDAQVGPRVLCFLPDIAGRGPSDGHVHGGQRVHRFQQCAAKRPAVFRVCNDDGGLQGGAPAVEAAE